MSFVLAPVIALFHYALQPLPVFAWLGAPVSALDVAGALRLAVALRQVRELYHDQHVTKANHKNRSGGKTSGKAQRVAADETLEPRSRARDFIATLVIVHGGEAIVGASRFPSSPRKGLLIWPSNPCLPRCYSISFSRSTLARPATCILRVKHVIHDVPRRTCARRPLANATEPIPTHRSSADHSPCVLSFDSVMQCSPESGRRTRLTCRSSVFIYPVVVRLGGCQPISPSPSLIESPDLGEWWSLRLQSFLAFASDADRGGHPPGAAFLRLDCDRFLVSHARDGTIRDVDPCPAFLYLHS
jgi:hypothetical protein